MGIGHKSVQETTLQWPITVKIPIGLPKYVQGYMCYNKCIHVSYLLKSF